MSKKRVALLAGSESDLPKIQSCVDILEEFDIACEKHVMSAHRTPERAKEFAENAEANGIQIIITAAGAAAHLGGVTAAHTCLPVIGIPIQGGAFNGWDALLSTVQMPGGVPVATVGVGKSGPKNAALLAVQMLALSDETLREKLGNYRERQSEAVIEADRKLQSGELE